VAETRAAAGFRSGEIARRAGVSADTLAHYERKCLLARPRRLPNGYRVYPPEALERVLLIQRALAVGFSLAELARLLRARDRGHPPCREVRDLARQKLSDVGQQLEDLARFREALQGIVSEGNFDAPMLIHDRIPPGVSTLKRKKSRIDWKFEETESGGRVRIRTRDPEALAAIHEFLRFQIEDHRTGDPTEIDAANRKD